MSPRWRVVLWLAFGALVAALPPIIANDYYIGVAVFVGIGAIAAIGLNLLMGYAGQVSLGHAAFMAIGGFTSAILTTRTGVSPWIAMACALLLASAVATLVGIPTLKLRGHYLAMATLGVGMIVTIILTQWDDFTGGTSGLTDIPYLSLAGVPLDNDVKYFYLVWALVALALLLSSNLIRSRVGRALRALHTGEVAAATCGVDIARTKLRVFVLSAALAALAGSLYAHHVHFVNPHNPFDFSFSIQLVVMVVLGGLATLPGSVVGAATVILLGEYLRSLGDFDVLAFGVILALVLIFLPRGIVGGAASLLQARRAAGGAAQES